MGTNPPSPRHRIEYLQQGVVISLPVAKHPLRLAWLGLLVLAFVIVTSIQVLNPVPLIPEAGIDFFDLFFVVLIIVIYGGTGMLFTIIAAWLLFGVEEVSVSVNGLLISHIIRGLRRERLFPAALIRNLRASAPEKVPLINQIESSIPKRRIGKISFDYGARTYRFFNDLEPDEAPTVAEILTDRLARTQNGVGRIKDARKIEKLHPPRHHVEVLDDAIRVILPGRKQLSRIFNSLYMIALGSLPAACIGFFIVSSIEFIRQSPENPLGAVFFWGGCLLPYIGLVLLLSYRTIGPMFATEIAEMDQDTLRHRTELMTLKRVNQYQTAAISNLRALPDSQFIPRNSFWSSFVGGQVSFEYEDRTILIFKDIEEAEAGMIAEQLRRFLPEERN